MTLAASGSYRCTGQGGGYCVRHGNKCAIVPDGMGAATRYPAFRCYDETRVLRREDRRGCAISMPGMDANGANHGCCLLELAQPWLTSCGNFGPWKLRRATMEQTCVGHASNCAGCSGVVMGRRRSGWPGRCRVVTRADGTGGPGCSRTCGRRETADRARQPIQPSAHAGLPGAEHSVRVERTG